MRRSAALLQAIRSHDPAQVKALLREGADPDSATWRNPLPASWQGRWLRWKIEFGLATGRLSAKTLFDPYFAHPIPALCLAVSERMPEDDAVLIVTALLQYGADINAANGIGNTALMDAANAGRVKLVDTLLSRGADTAPSNSSGHTALIVAPRSGKLEVVQRLLEARPNLDTQDHWGNTALIAACGSPSRYPMAKLLLEAGANVHLKDRNGIDALATARSNGCEEIVNLLLLYVHTPQNLG